MTTQRARFSLATATAVVIALGVPARAIADPLTCTTGIARAAARHLQGLTKAMQKCEDSKARFRLRATIDCATDPLFDPIRLALLTKLFASINVACGGPNEDCGDGDDEPLGPTGWGTVGQCPDMNGAGCTNPIGTCVDISRCLECIDRAAVAQVMDTVYGALDATEFGSNSDTNRCQRAIGKATARYLGKRSKALEKCWEARLNGDHANPCPSPGDGKAASQIASAETKKRATICRSCGGADRQCDGAGDTSPSDVGFVASCPAVTPLFPPASCGAPVSNAAAIVDCADCIADFDTDCAGAASVPSIVGALPAACNPTASPTTSTTTSSSTSSSSSTSTSSTSTSTVAGSTSSSTSSTTSTSAPVPTTSSTSSTTSTVTTTSSTTTTGGGGPSAFDFLSTAGSGNCGNTFRDLAGTIPLKNLVCGNLSIGGGLSQVPDNSTPSGATNRFGLSCVGAACTVGPVSPATAAYDCTDVGCLFGTPLPISNAGLSVCVTNTFTSPVSGTLNTSSGDATLNLQLNSATILTGFPTQPCPICAVSVGGAACVGSVGSPCTGVCDGSPNQGAACTTKNPNGLTSGCPAPAATSGIQKCYRGTNNGATCSTGGDCPGGLCAQFIGNIPISLNPLTTGTASLSNAGGLFCAGQTATQKGAFRTMICRDGVNSGKPCAVVADCGAGGTECRLGGPLNNYCTAGTNNGKGCGIASDCGTGGVCGKAGTVVQLIREVGSPTGALTTGVGAPIKLGAAFCVIATTNPTVNANANLPGPGATAVVGTVTLVP